MPIVQQRCAVMRKNCATKVLYSGECEGRSEGRKSVDSESVPSGSEDVGAKAGSDFGRERDVVETEQNRCEPVCRGELHLTTCD